MQASNTARTPHPLLEGPVAPALLRLALPVLVVLALNTLVGMAEIYFVGTLGTAAVAGVALVFPLFMLMTMMSNGGFGGGVASAVARALGAGRRAEAERLAFQALLLAGALGALFSIGFAAGGRWILAAMGGVDEALGFALEYGDWVFAGAIPAWVASLLAAALRGAGNVRVPAIVTATGSLIALVASPALILGWAGLPALGVTGAGLAVFGLNIGMAFALAAYMRRPGATLRLGASLPERRLFADILRVGFPSALGTIVSNLSVIVATALAGRFGAAAIAGYGLASRLDYLAVPLLFAIGTATVTLVGTAIGAGRAERARAAATTAAWISTTSLAAIGGLAAVAPGVWMRLFSNDAEVLAVGAAYLRHVGPAYAFFGLGMSLYFASQGTGRVLWPLAAGLVRLGVLAAGGALWIGVLGGGLAGFFHIVALGYVAFGALTLFAFATGRGWPARPSTVPQGEARAASV
jgi:putative MATE family efflux protein